MKLIKENQLYFARLYEDVKLPTKKDENMGYDIYPYFEEDYMMINPHETKMIPTGLCSACSEDYGILLKERGSTGSKGIAQRCGCIDSGYRGEWFVPITNTSNKKIVLIKNDILIQIRDYRSLPTKRFFDKYGDCSLYYINDILNRINLNDDLIYPYEKAICQAIIIPVPKMQVTELSVEELQSIPSERGEGKIGSSGK